MKKTSDYSNERLITYIRNCFYNSSDFVIREMDWQKESVIICYYSTVVDKGLMNEQLANIKRFWFNSDSYGETFISKTEAFRMDLLREKVVSGNAVVIFPKENLLMSLEMQKVATRSPDEPKTEQVIRGSHEGFVENIDINISLIRKRVFTHDLVVRNFAYGDMVKSNISIVYLESIAEKETVDLLVKKIKNVSTELVGSAGQVEDFLEESVWSPFPQLLNTERPDRVVSNLIEGKIAVFTDSSPTALVAPTTFFSFYQSIDDFNSRTMIGSFYRIVRLFGFFTAILLPGVYIAVVSFHPEVLPVELYNKIKMVVNDIPYRPLLEALLLELMIELIREAGIRLPAPIGQTIGIVGGLVIGDAIVNAGLASNVMIIVVALTALSSFVVPSAEMNTTIRLLRFPFMALASVFGFFGLAIGSMMLFIHMLGLSSLKQPYLSPFIPFQPKEFRKVFLRLPKVKPKVQTDNFKIPNGEKENES